MNVHRFSLETDNFTRRNYQKVNLLVGRLATGTVITKFVDFRTT